MDDMARKKSKPMLRFTTAMVGATGTMAKDSKTVTTITAGAITKTGLSAKGGIQSSLAKILIMSASTCSNPNGPTRLGPYRSCHSANSRRSSQMSPALTESSTARRPTMMISDRMGSFTLLLGSYFAGLARPQFAPRRQHDSWHSGQAGGHHSHACGQGRHQLDREVVDRAVYTQLKFVSCPSPQVGRIFRIQAHVWLWGPFSDARRQDNQFF